MEFIKKCVRILRPIFRDIQILFIAGFCVVCEFSAFVTLFGAFGINSIGMRLIVFAIFLVMPVILCAICRLMFRLKNSVCRNMAPAPAKSESAAVPVKSESASAKEQQALCDTAN